MGTKSLYIIRHAKAEDYALARNDYNRQLIDKGRQRAQHIATQVALDITPAGKIQFLSSSAARALQTAEIFADILNFDSEKIIQTKSIYEAHYRDILAEINKIPDEVQTLMVFGHNPGLSQLIAYVTDEHLYLKTSYVAKIILEDGIHFSELTSGIATLKEIFTDNNS